MSDTSDFEILFRYEYSSRPPNLSREPSSPPRPLSQPLVADICDSLHHADEERSVVRTACVNSAIKKNESPIDRRRKLEKQRAWRYRAHKRIVKLGHEIADAGSDVFLIVIPRHCKNGNGVLGCVSDRFRHPAVDEEDVYRTTRLLLAQNEKGREQRAREKYTEYHLNRKDKYRTKIRKLIVDAN